MARQSFPPTETSVIPFISLSPTLQIIRPLFKLYTWRSSRFFVSTVTATLSPVTGDTYPTSSAWILNSISTTSGKYNIYEKGKSSCLALDLGNIEYYLFTANIIDFKLYSAFNLVLSGPDPGFPIGGGANPPGGRQHMILSNFAKNCMKLRKFWAMGGRPSKSTTGHRHL